MKIPCRIQAVNHFPKNNDGSGSAEDILVLSLRVSVPAGFPGAENPITMLPIPFKEGSRFPVGSSVVLELTPQVEKNVS